MGKVLTLYVDLNPADFGTQPARAAEIASLLDAARRRVREADLDRSARADLLAQVDRTQELLRNGSPATKGAHALAIFASPSDDLYEVLRLPHPVPGAAVVDDVPWLEPLIGRERLRRCLALVSRRATRLLADTRTGELREVADIVDDVHGQHDQGGWSQARYERSIEQDVHRHLEGAADALFALHRRRPFDLLAVGTSPELWPELERALHPYVRERAVGRFDVDVERATPGAALAAAQPLLDAAEERHIADLLERLRVGIAHRERAAVGLGAVLQAIGERRVEALLYEAGLRLPGFVCPEAGWLGEHADGCPLGVDQAQPHENVLEPAISAALLQAADVVALRDRAELGPLGGVAAVLRF